MKRFLVVSVKEGEDSKTKEKLLFVSMYRMPSKMKNGGLWYVQISKNKQQKIKINSPHKKAILALVLARNFSVLLENLLERALFLNFCLATAEKFSRISF